MTFPYVHVLGLGLVVALGLAAYEYFNGESQQQEHDYQRRQQPRRDQPEELRRRIPRRRTPVRPNKDLCQIPTCRNSSSSLCTACNFHFCASHNEEDECPYCNRRNTIQNFDESCICCAEQIYNLDLCYLTSCKHIFHTQCLHEWYINNPENPSCITCREPFTLYQISTDFAAAENRTAPF